MKKENKQKKYYGLEDTGASDEEIEEIELIMQGVWK